MNTESSSPLAANAGSPPAQPWVQLGVWGDSIVHGGCDDELGGWVTRLKLYLYRRGLGDHTFNLGLGGNTSRQVADRISPELAARRMHIDHALISVGVNDTRCPVSPEEFKSNLEDILAAISNFGKTAHLVTMTLMQGDIERWEKLNEVIIQVATERGCGLIDLRCCLSASDLLDYVHPVASGHEKIFQAVKTALLLKGIIPPGHGLNSPKKA